RVCPRRRPLERPAGDRTAMAKMFYTIEEAAQKLGKSEAQVREMAASGQIQEFRDRDKLMFKVEQIDLLASGDEVTGDIPLALEDSRLGGSSLDLQDSGIGLVDSREGTGISAFDTDHGEPRDLDRTQPGEDELSLEAVGTGSGLLDLTRESDDTSLGAELLEEVYSSDDNVEIPANASGIFEQGGAESPGNAIRAGACAPIVVETYDGAWSGLGLGLM